MRLLFLLALSATTTFAQSPGTIVRRVESRRAEARRAVQRAIESEQLLRRPTIRRGTVAVITSAVAEPQQAPLARGIADLLVTDLARVHGLRALERMSAQAIVNEQSLAGVDESTRPRAWLLLGAADVVVVEAVLLGSATSGSVRMTARVVNMMRERVDASVSESGPARDLFATQRRLSVAVLRTLGIELTASERRAIVERPSGNVDALLAWSAAMDAIEGGNATQGERLLRQALEFDPGVNAVFDAGLLADADVSGTLSAVVPMPGMSGAAGDDPTAAGLATEGNESEYGEVWFEGAGDRRLNLYEMAVPLSASLPLGKGRFDLSTLWSSNRADTPANDVFHAWGFTDVHVRYTHPLGATGASFSVGGALPTRNVHGVDDDIRRVPIPPDLLPSAMYRRRSASSASGGLFFTRSAGIWEWGAAAGAEWNKSFDELSPSLHTVAVSPGMRYRLRADAERSWGPGRLALAGSLMTSAPAKRAGAQVTGGTRSLVRSSYAWPVGGTDIEVGGWLLHSAPVSSGGTQVRAASSIRAVFANSRTTWAGWQLDAGVEMKAWSAGGRNAADLFVPQGSVSRALTRALRLEVGADYVSGHFHEAPSTTDIPVRGWMLRTGFSFEP